MRSLVIVLVVLFALGAFGSAPFWQHQGFGLRWGPSGGLGAVVLILIILLLAGVI